MGTMVPTGTLARGPLMLSLRLRLMLMLTTAPLATIILDTPTTDTTDSGPMLPLPTAMGLITMLPTPTTMVPTGTFGKRSADAEPEAEADADAYYTTLGYNGLGYANFGYNRYRSYVAPAYTRSFGYASPYAYNYGAYRHFGKRSADAEPEADAYYSTLGYHGLGYSNYGFNGYRSYVAPAYNYGSYSYASPYAYGRYHY